MPPFCQLLAFARFAWKNGIVRLAIVAAGKFRVHVLNLFGKEPDNGNAKNPLKAKQQFDADSGDAQLDPGEHVAADIDSRALQSNRQMLLRPVPLGSQP